MISLIPLLELDGRNDKLINSGGGMGRRKQTREMLANWKSSDERKKISMLGSNPNPEFIIF